VGEKRGDPFLCFDFRRQHLPRTTYYFQYNQVQSQYLYRVSCMVQLFPMPLYALLSEAVSPWWKSH
jgi:hypothetical protein